MRRKRDAGVWSAMGGCGEQFEVKKKGGKGTAVQEGFHFFLRGDRGSVQPKGGAPSRNPTRAISQDDLIMCVTPWLYVTHNPG